MREQSLGAVEVNEVDSHKNVSNQHNSSHKLLEIYVAKMYNNSYNGLLYMFKGRLL